MSFQLNTSVVANLSAQNAAQNSQQNPTLEELTSRLNMQGGNVPQAQTPVSYSNGLSAGAGVPTVPEQQGGSLLRITDHGGSAGGGLPNPGMPSSLSGLIDGGGGTGGTGGSTAAGQGAPTAPQGPDGAAAASSLSDMTAKMDQESKQAADQIAADRNADASAMANYKPPTQGQVQAMADANQAQQPTVHLLMQG